MNVRIIGWNNGAGSRSVPGTGAKLVVQRQRLIRRSGLSDLPAAPGGAGGPNRGTTDAHGSTRINTYYLSRASAFSGHSLAKATSGLCVLWGANEQIQFRTIEVRRPQGPLRETLREFYRKSYSVPIHIGTAT